MLHVLQAKRYWRLRHRHLAFLPTSSVSPSLSTSQTWTTRRTSSTWMVSVCYRKTRHLATCMVSVCYRKTRHLATWMVSVCYRMTRHLPVWSVLPVWLLSENSLYYLCGKILDITFLFILDSSQVHGCSWPRRFASVSYGGLKQCFEWGVSHERSAGVSCGKYTLWYR